MDFSISPRRSQDAQAPPLFGAIADIGKPICEIAEELGMSSDLVYRWRRERQRQVGSAGTRADLSALVRENARLRMENDFFKKAAIILGTQSPQSAEK